MKLSLRLYLLMILLTLLPAIPTAWIMHQLISESLNVGLNPQVDGALEAGVRQARESLLGQRRKLEGDLDRLLVRWGEQVDVAADLPDRITQMEGVVFTPGDHVILISPSGVERVLQSSGDQPDPPPPTPAEGVPPHRITTTREVAYGWRVSVVRPLSVQWRQDARILATTFQDIRGLQAQRRKLERVYWLPFLSIYGLALALGLLLATRLGNGITSPVRRLLSATGAVAKGDWTTQVSVSSRDEIGHLTERFNAMVRTLDAQSRNLIDLEKMTGWREMARALAHEVKNPLTPIQLTVEEMSARYRGDDREYRELLTECTRIVVEEVESLRNVVTRFRKFSRPIEPQMSAVDLNGLLTDLAALQKGMEVDLDLDDDLGEIQADPDRLRQVLMNLSQNARSATAKVSIPRLRLSSAAGENTVVIEVEDNGPGIPVADRERVFEPYRSGTVGGLGLGLALVKGIVLAHRGSIVVTDGSLGGACLRLELPRSQPATAADSEVAAIENRELKDV